MTASRRFTLSIATVAVALTFAATGAFACEEHAKAAADAKDVKDAKAVPAVAEKGCDMPCCAKKGAAAEAKNGAAPAAGAPVAAVNGDAKAEAPCAAAAKDGKGCAKKAAEAKAEPAKEAPKAEPTVNSGASR